MATPVITFSLLPQSVQEDGGGAFVYTFTRTGDLSAPLTVAYKLAGTAQPGTDFTFGSPSVTFQAGSATATLTITPKADTVIEPDETVSVELIPSYTIGTAGPVEGTIANDDFLPPSLAIAATDASKPEGNAGTTIFTFTVTRSGHLGGSSLVNWAVSGNVNATDFGGTIPSGTISFAPNETSKLITVNVTADTSVEPNEVFTVTLSGANNATVTTASATSTIANDDVAPAPTTSLFTTQIPTQPNFTEASDWECGMKFSASTPGQIHAIRYFKSPGESGSHTGRIWSSAGAPLASIVFANETASGWQEQALSTPLNINANTVYTVSVNVWSHYALTTGGFNTQVSNGGLTAAVGAGVYNENQGAFPSVVYQGWNYFRDVVFLAAGVVVTVTVAPSSAMEDGTANLVYTFTRTGNLANPLTVNYTVSGTATIGTDYTGITTSGTTKNVTFAAGSATAIVTVNPTADTTGETDETVMLTLATGTGYAIGTPGAVTGIITNDDATPPPPPAAGTIPTFYDHPMFAGSVNVPGQIVVGSATITNRTANSSRGEASSIIFMDTDGGQIVRCRGIGREGIRVGGATVGIDSCFIDVTGRPGDHSDALQVYAPNTPPGITLTLRNSFLRCNLASDGSANSAYFTGGMAMHDHVIENCVFAGGGYTVRIPGEGGNSLSMKDVYFVDKSWVYAPFLSDPNGPNGSQVNIIRWENVRLCTIVNNEIIPGALIPRPY